MPMYCTRGSPKMISLHRIQVCLNLGGEELQDMCSGRRFTQINTGMSYLGEVI